MIEIKNYINGKFVPPISGRSIENFEPATGQVFGTVPDSDMEDVAAAYNAAKNAYPLWKNTPAESKFRVLNKIADLIEVHIDKLAKAESRDQGKPVWLAKNEMKRASQNFRFFATAAIQFASESHAMEDRAINYTLRQPLGVVGCISPWNLPLYLFSWKIAPALAAGNCVVAKPSEFTPYTAFLLGEICTEAGLPPGVLNILHGLGTSVGQGIVEHPGIKAISFTGGTQTGKRIASIAGPMFKKMSLELGGKNPNIIFADADIDKALDTTIRSSFLNQGEICLCGSRVFVERTIYEDFKNRLVKEVAALKVGNPELDDVKVGAMVSRPHFEKVLGYIKLAKEEGANVLTGGIALQPDGFENGWFIAPTILEGLPFDCRTNQEEIFGPVITIMPFDTEEEVLNYANSTQYGLACTIWTNNLTRAHRMAGLMESGIVWINCWLLRDLRTPFGGVKQSGAGREGGWEAMKFFTEPKNVCIAL